MRNLTPAELAAVAAVDRDRIADDLAALVRIPSPTGDEGAVQTEAALRMATAGLAVERLDADPAALAADPAFPGMEAPRSALPLVRGVLAGDGPGPRVVLCGHVDTVPPGAAAGWRDPPYGAAMRDGALIGRGACDMKGGVVAALAALRALAVAGVPLAGEASLVTVPAEEDGGAGALAAIRAGWAGDACVITEPTALSVVIAQAGAITFRVTVAGRAAHAAFRRRGVSALDKLGVVLDALARDEERRNAAEAMPAMRDLGLPYPTSIGRVEGGEWASTVPDLVVADGRYGVAVGQSTQEAEDELRAAIAAACAEDPWLAEHPPEVAITGGRFASAALPATHPLPWAVGGAARDVLGRLPDFVGVPYGSDMRLFVHEAGTPAVLYGPGDPTLAHAGDERVDLEDVARCARVLAVWAMRALSDI